MTGGGSVPLLINGQRLFVTAESSPPGRRAIAMQGAIAISIGVRVICDATRHISAAFAGHEPDGATPYFYIPFRFAAGADGDFDLLLPSGSARRGKLAAAGHGRILTGKPGGPS